MIHAMGGIGIIVVLKLKMRGEFAMRALICNNGFLFIASIAGIVPSASKCQS